MVILPGTWNYSLDTANSPLKAAASLYSPAEQIYDRTFEN